MKRIREGLMKARRSRRLRVKSKRGPDRRHKTTQRTTVDDADISQINPTHSLLLSSLRFWEVERDLIEERVAAIGR